MPSLILYRPLCLPLVWQGRFEILCLSGSYLVIEEGGSRTRSGGLCIALCGPDHRVIGGSVGGVLTAAGTVQVVMFVYAMLSNQSRSFGVIWFGCYLN